MSFRSQGVKAVALVALLVVSGCDDATSGAAYSPTYADKPASSQNVYIFGIHPLHNPKRLHEVFAPLAAYLSSKIKDATFRIEASRNYAAFDKKLYAGKFHFSLPNPFQTVNSLKHGYHVFGKMGDDDNFRGIILVRKDAGITKAADLKGRAISYPAPTALAATMMPQYFLHTNGLDVMHETEARYVGSQESSMMNVYLRDTAAGATWPPPWRAFAKERPEMAKEMEVKWRTPPLPNNGLVVRDDVPADLTQRVAGLLFALHEHKAGQEILARMELSRFEKADDQTYSPVVDFLEKFAKAVRPID